MATSPITLKLGERLSLLVTAKSNGTAITLTNAWQVSSYIAPASSPATATDLGAVIESGKVRIDFDTIDLSVGNWVMDIRFTDSTTGDHYSENISVILKTPITPASARA